ncbi:hypothetical protein ADL35_16560 [Streptomyces sp. NRRL WC-3753]|nr:hypothetical protein ADL35_16560 [Streptomyces sp. NRRL WC-3753]
MDQADVPPDPAVPFFGWRRAIIRSYRVSFPFAFLPCEGCGRSCASDVVVAVSRTPQSTPRTRPVAGRGWTWAGTTKEQYQCPRLSWYTRTEDGSAGNSLDHTTDTTIPPARCSRPSFSRNPRRV